MNNQTGKLSGNSGLLFVPQRLMEGMEFAALRDGFYRLDCSKTDLATDLPMGCKGGEAIGIQKHFANAHLWLDLISTNQHSL